MSGKSEMGEIWAGVREEMKERNAARKKASMEMLGDLDIVYEDPMGTQDHLIILKDRKRWADFWPSTGRWCIRSAMPQRGRYIEKLLKAYGIE